MDIAKQVLNINVNDILPNRFQPRIRFSEEALAELTNSIKEHGVIQPITVRPVGNKYEIVAGERRYKASVLAGKETIPAIVVNLDDNSCAELALIENVQRQDLTPIEEAISYKKILDMGTLTQEALAIKVGKNQSTIANKLRLLNLDEEVQKALLENRISERHARSLLKLNDNNLQKNILNRIISERLTVRRTDEEIDNLLNQNTNSTNVYEAVNQERVENSHMGSNNINQFNAVNSNLGSSIEPVNKPINASNIPTAPIEENLIENNGLINQSFNNPSDLDFNPSTPTNQSQPNQFDGTLNITNQTDYAANNIYYPEQEKDQQPITSTDDLNRLIEQANQITPDFSVGNEAVTNSVNETQPQIQKALNDSNPGGEISAIFNNQSTFPSFNNMEIQPQMDLANQTNIPSTPIEESEQLNNQNETMSFNSNVENIEESPETELRPIKFFNMAEEPTSEALVEQEKSDVSNIFNIQPEVLPSQSVTTDFVTQSPPEQPKNEFVENLEDQAVNMDFGTNQVPTGNFDFSDNLNKQVENLQVHEEAPVQSINIPESPTMSSTVDIPPFIREEPKELQPKMPEIVSQPTRRVNIKEAINEIRASVNRIEDMGFNIDTDEYDLENIYQIVFRIDKE